VIHIVADVVVKGQLEVDVWLAGVEVNAGDVNIYARHVHVRKPPQHRRDESVSHTQDKEEKIDAVECSQSS
jgi:hypothetical protein